MRRVCALRDANAEIASSATQIENPLSVLQLQQVNLPLHESAVARRCSQELNSKTSVSTNQVIVPELPQIYPRRWPPPALCRLHLSEFHEVWHTGAEAPA
jgi:hypothetical protein